MSVSYGCMTDETYVLFTTELDKANLNGGLIILVSKAVSERLSPELNSYENGL